ncbi:DUF4178 domain-containing protein [Asticcacaulis sp. 201]|uniref:DUF4178 domain-containing protein n=1 Tax=Asticcacaulis sp. 201 TaxID=3028787 RepID=UPI002916EE75|nr:DUF4178 domain-containing protein [Asticcacaulis sp. 201]MDV6333251.1 DUF4178 domain-containing protein [Asticcacaulis sp. 201]
MAEFTCPSCGAPVRFTSSVTVSAVCSYCQTLVVRKDLDVEAIGKMATLPEDMTPFRIGTEAYDGAVAIRLIGRVRMAWADGFWNEWFFVREDGGKGWLAEAQGTYALSYEPDAPVEDNIKRAVDRWVAQKDTISTIVGKTLILGDQLYTVTDRKVADCVACEGELPIISPRGRRSVSFDFMGETDTFASVESSNDEVRVFVGRYVEWGELKASKLKPVKGWS